ncbi:hypothetical protein ACP3UN_08885, partial [Klebsiella pneumoniae]
KTSIINGSEVSRLSVAIHRVLKNGWGVIPLGAVATVTHQSPKGSELTFEPCDCCGLKAIISHVSMDSIEFIEPITEEEDGREQAQH